MTEINLAVEVIEAITMKDKLLRQSIRVQIIPEVAWFYIMSTIVESRPTDRA